MCKKRRTFARKPAVSPQEEDKVREGEIDVDVLEVEENREERCAAAEVVLVIQSGSALVCHPPA